MCFGILLFPNLYIQGEYTGAIILQVQSINYTGFK
jgi:hypothetical protein